MKILKFSLPNCAPCKTLSAQIKNLKIENITEINLEQAIELGMKYKIRNVPTLIILDDNENEVERFVGGKNCMDYIEKISQK